MNTVVRLVECFPSWQGEGPDSGKWMLIARFKRCNRVDDGNACPWCDTRTKMRLFEEAEFSFGRIQNTINEQKCGVMITGGEPTYGFNLESSIKMLNKLNYSIANVETNGHKLEELIKGVNTKRKVRYIFSPKMFKPEEFEYHMKFVETVVEPNPKIFIKIVYDGRKELDIYLEKICELNLNDRTYLMPQGTTMNNLIDNSGIVFDIAEKYKLNFSSRNHVIYGFV